VGKALQKLRTKVPTDLAHLPHRVLLGVLYGAYCPPELCAIRPVSKADLPEQAPGASKEVAAVAPGGKVLGGARLQLPTPLPEKPYPSLRYYEHGDRPLFAGRDGDIARCAQILGAADTRMLVLHGESGCGKSSFLRAGLLPHLEEECVGFRALQEEDA